MEQETRLNKTSTLEVAVHMLLSYQSNSTRGPHVTSLQSHRTICYFLRCSTYIITAIRQTLLAKQRELCFKYILYYKKAKTKNPKEL